MTHGSNCKIETRKNEGKKNNCTMQEELAYPDCIICLMKEQIRRYLARFSPKGTHT